jgi:hypothetical protein
MKSYSPSIAVGSGMVVLRAQCAWLGCAWQSVRDVCLISEMANGAPLDLATHQDVIAREGGRSSLCAQELDAPLPRGMTPRVWWAARLASAFSDSLIKQPARIAPRAMRMDVRHRPGICGGPVAVVHFLAPSKRGSGAPRRRSGLLHPRAGLKAKSPATRLRGVSAPCDRGPPLGAPLAALFDAGPRFPGHFRPDQPAPGGRTVVSSRRSPGSPDGRLRACPQEAAPCSAFQASLEDALR